MTPENQNSSLDQLLDAGLKQYGDAEPRPGLEERILANARAAQEKGPSLLWVPVFAAGAALLATVVIVGISRRTAQETLETRAPSPPPALASVVSIPRKPEIVSTPVRPLSAHVAAKQVRVRATAKNAEPRQAQFPAVRPLSEQEKLLLAFAQRTPAQEVARAAAQPRDIKTLHVEDLQIAPLQ